MRHITVLNTYKGVATVFNNFQTGLYWNHETKKQVLDIFKNNKKQTLKYLKKYKDKKYVRWLECK